MLCVRGRAWDVHMTARQQPSPGGGHGWPSLDRMSWRTPSAHGCSIWTCLLANSSCSAVWLLCSASLCLHNQVLLLAHFYADLMPSCICLQSLHVLAAPNWPSLAHSEALADSPLLIGAHRSDGDPLKGTSRLWGLTSLAGTLPADAGRCTAEPALVSEHSSHSAGKAWSQAFVG